MKKNYLIWLIGGAALYFLTRKKTSTSTDTDLESTDTTSSDVGNQTNDKPNAPANAPANVIQPAVPNEMRSNITPPAATIVAPKMVDVRVNPAVGTPPQIPTNFSKDRFSID
jgi:hypothetical protein